jgi:drug/metabolite transporter (DMT)-like permease
MIYGVVFSLLASVCYSVSNLVEKTAVDHMPEISARRVGHMIQQIAGSRLWVSGFVAGVVAVILTVISYSLTPIVVVQTIVAAGLALLVLGSRLFLREPIGRKEYLGLCLIIGAVVLISVTLSSSAAIGIENDTRNVVIASVATAVLAALAFRLLSVLTPNDASVPFGVTSGLFYGVASLQAKGAATILQRHGLIAGVPHVLESPYPYVFLITSIVGLLIFQSGLQRSRVAVIGPFSSIVASIYVVVVGMLIFHESFPRDGVLTFLRVLGFAFALGGSWIFSEPLRSHRREPNQ